MSLFPTAVPAERPHSIILRRVDWEVAVDRPGARTTVIKGRPESVIFPG